MRVYRGNFSEEKLSPYPFKRLLIKIYAHRECPMGVNFKLKVLGKEFEEKPFFKRVFLNNMYKASI